MNNAGLGNQNLFLDVPEEELDSLWAVNVKPIVNLGQVMVKKLLEEKKPGVIVNVSSQASLIGMPRHTTYGATKAAMDQITRVMAAELGELPLEEFTEKSHFFAEFIISKSHFLAKFTENHIFGRIHISIIHFWQN